MPPDVRFAVLEPTDCDGCGLCCRGIGSPPAIYTYRISRSGKFLFRPVDLPAELGQQLDDYFYGLLRGQEPVDNCIWLDQTTGKCKHYAWRPQVCRTYEVGCDACLNERRPYVTDAKLPTEQDEQS